MAHSPLTAALVQLAEDMGLGFEATVALPAVITSAARKAMMSDAAMVHTALGNPELRDYLAGICNDVDVAEALA